MVHVSDDPSQFVQRVGLHHDVILGQQQSGDLGQFADGRRVGVRDDAAQLVQGIVQIVHPSPLSSVDAQPDGFALSVLPRRAGIRRTRRHSGWMTCHARQSHGRLVMRTTDHSTSAAGSFSFRQTVVLFQQQTAIFRMEVLVVATW